MAWVMLILFLGCSAASLGIVLVQFRRYRLWATYAMGFQTLVRACHTMHKWLRRRGFVDEDSARIDKLAAQRRTGQALTAFYFLFPIIWFTLTYQSWELFQALHEHDAAGVRVIVNQSVAIPMYIAQTVCTYCGRKKFCNTFYHTAS